MSSTQSLAAVSPSEAVIQRIADCENLGPLELSPLYEAIDPDALDQLVGSTVGQGAPVEISFTYHGYEVTVTGEGVVHLEKADAPLAGV